MFTIIKSCRLCGNELRPLFDVPAPLVSCFPGRSDAQPPAIPTVVVQCLYCEHVQLWHTTAPELLYGDYWYESGVNERMRQELATVVTRAQDYCTIDRADAVLDLGANDGTLLREYQRQCPSTRPHLVAVDPSPTFQSGLRVFCDATIQGCFPDCVRQVPDYLYKVITTIAMFYDLPDPVAAAQEIRRLLHPAGVWVCQFQDLEQQVRAGAWDNFVHEHLSYHTLKTFQSVCVQAGLQVVDVERTDINGGSLRVFVKQWGQDQERPAVREQLYAEYATLHDKWPRDFQIRMRANIRQIQTYVEYAAAQGPVDLYGASTKANTLLQATGVSGLLRWAWERNPRKVGRFTVTGVPITSEAEGRQDPPYALLSGIWQFKKQLIAREAETLKTTRLIVPLPEATWVETSEPERKRA